MMVLVLVAVFVGGPAAFVIRTVSWWALLAIDVSLLSRFVVGLMVVESSSLLLELSICAIRSIPNANDTEMIVGSAEK